MDDTTLRVTARSSSSGSLILAVEGYLDEEGGSTLARETSSARATDHRLIRIDLGFGLNKEGNPLRLHLGIGPDFQ